MTFAVFSHSNKFLENGYQTLEDAKRAASAYVNDFIDGNGGDSEAYAEEVCPDHLTQPYTTCTLCDETEDYSEEFEPIYSGKPAWN